MNKVKDQAEISLRIPELLACNGRLILQAVKKADAKSESGIIIPVNYEIWTQDRKSDRERAQEDNPYKWYDFYVVGMAPEVTTQMQLENGIIPEIGDKVIVSERFEPSEVYRHCPLNVHELLLKHISIIRF